MQGDIRAASEKGQGSTFSVTVYFTAGCPPLPHFGICPCLALFAHKALVTGPPRRRVIDNPRPLWNIPVAVRVTDSKFVRECMNMGLANMGALFVDVGCLFACFDFGCGAGGW